MPLVRFDVVEGRDDGEIKDLLDAAHRAALSAFHVPENDVSGLEFEGHGDIDSRIATAQS